MGSTPDSTETHKLPPLCKRQVGAGTGARQLRKRYRVQPEELCYVSSTEVSTMAGRGVGDMFRNRLRGQELSYTREMDKHSIKSIRDALKGTDAMDEARARIDAALAKECDGDVLAEVSAARVAGKFKEQDLPLQAVTMRPVMYKPKTKIESDHDDFLRHIDVPQTNSGMDVAASSYHDMSRGRYTYLNEFMETMQVDDAERRPMTQRELKRLEKHLNAGRHNILYVAGSFVCGTALLGVVSYATWIYTKRSMGVNNTEEYAAKMRGLTPEMKKDMDESVLGRSMKRFRSGVQNWIAGNQSLANMSAVMKTNMAGMAGPAATSSNEGSDVDFVHYMSAVIKTNMTRVLVVSTFVRGTQAQASDQASDLTGDKSPAMAGNDFGDKSPAMAGNDFGDKSPAMAGNGFRASDFDDFAEDQHSARDGDREREIGGGGGAKAGGHLLCDVVGVG
eukprot:CAMPEP_0173414386 /NCGR_PEP_ID=MMETSP1356-20130122/84299_1 /TAXON_ID=77927 ORGANISM="Hemiselmis virescens, Strain PCC157" /NCGR_SAMPLE_ID=MMETSP1356 /ASSEMBLY_ACC=CAM_ASM_000847 /LENGTH=448 /DNA_ID=CAMNT_0014376563 /DNA_START=1 /DNA_END=1350 /DNA_ORIENTATION=-